MLLQSTIMHIKLCGGFKAMCREYLTTLRLLQVVLNVLLSPQFMSQSAQSVLIEYIII